ncbi:HAD family hydrolase [Kitasatospora kifunensis]|uniref:HAD superfamily hydrolase (TIGR01490 family) n=1 Tax=Kitasatospora kifunensis TaxID=58351 RepID=A0A7W7R573_KITKI|nr:HAD-IB family hydrolase [Kitasatospora kifunensis]MBB4925076.1 HAD superfamily hydrolase (TIGR01490 family) [Kitasatospora kifunensis]
MAALRRLTQARRSSSERAALAGEAAAQAAEQALRERAASTSASARESEATPAPAIERDAEQESAAPPVDHPQGAAFFDCDNTILQGAAVFYLGVGLYRRNFFTRRDVAKFAWQQAWFRLLGTEDPGHIADAQHTALSLVAGKRTADLEAICEEIFEEIVAAKVWPGTRALVQMHLDAGQRVWLVTAAPQEVARIIARRLGMTGALGTVAEATDGCYTGRLVGEMLHGPAKAAAVRALARHEQLDLGHCAAYSDSANDIPMLSLVGHPFVINPDARLRKYARAHGWRVQDFRTGRKAARIGVPAAVVLGAAAGATVAAVALRRKRS